jgi:hypothetical protein
VKAIIYYQKHPNFLMSRDEAAKLTLADIENNYGKVAEIDVSANACPDDIFLFYQDKTIPLPAGVNHSSMSVGDIVVIGSTLHVCLDVDWYSVPIPTSHEIIKAS